MTMYTPSDIKQKIIVAYKTGKYTQTELSAKYGIKRQTVWGIIQKQNGYPTINPRPKPSKLEIATVLRGVDWNENELNRIWDLMKQILKKKFKTVRIGGKTYELE